MKDERKYSMHSVCKTNCFANRVLPLPAVPLYLKTTYPNASHAQRAPAADFLQYDETPVFSSVKARLVVVCESWRLYEPL